MGQRYKTIRTIRFSFGLPWTGNLKFFSSRTNASIGLYQRILLTPNVFWNARLARSNAASGKWPSIENWKNRLCVGLVLMYFNIFNHIFRLNRVFYSFSQKSFASKMLSFRDIWYEFPISFPWEKKIIAFCDYRHLGLGIIFYHFWVLYYFRLL